MCELAHAAGTISIVSLRRIEGEKGMIIFPRTEGARTWANRNKFVWGRLFAAAAVMAINSSGAKAGLLAICGTLELTWSYCSVIL